LWSRYDALGPGSHDNAGGLAEMAGMCKMGGAVRNRRQRTRCGRDTQGGHKRICVGLGGLGALRAVLPPTNEHSNSSSQNTRPVPLLPGCPTRFHAHNPPTLSGCRDPVWWLCLIFSGMGMTDVGRAASASVEEVRRQSATPPGTQEGDRQADLPHAVEPG